MVGPASPPIAERVLVLAPTPADAALTRTLLSEAGVACHVCHDLPELCQDFSAGAATILLTEDALADGDSAFLAEAIQRQPPWSDVPILLLTSHGTDSPIAATAMDLLGNVTVLERPVRITTLISALRTSLRARQRQYELRSRLETLRKQSERLREQDRKKDDFLATLAHELRNPLAPIRNAAQYLRLNGPPDPELRNARDIIERQLRQLTRLVDDLLDINRITRGKIVLQREKVDVGVAVTNAIEASRPLVEDRRHRLTVSMPMEPLFVKGDAARLAQVFGNLLTNAAKYTDPGGLIHVDAEREGSDAVVTVTDTGIGIAGEHLPGLFDMFSQVAPALERSQGGLGIGLALVRNLVEMHRGRVDVHSEGPGRGSTFRVRLPLLIEPSERSKPVQPAKAAGGAKRPAKCRVLVADDSVDSAQSLAMMLSIGGHEVRTAYDGLAAVELAAQFRPDVILLDIGMPMLNGYQAARQIRRQPWGERILLVALTGWGQEDDKRRAEEAGFDHHFTKPVDPDALDKLLRELTSRTH